jgi:hypothetical protein
MEGHGELVLAQNKDFEVEASEMRACLFLNSGELHGFGGFLRVWLEVCLRATLVGPYIWIQIWSKRQNAYQAMLETNLGTH